MKTISIFSFLFLFAACVAVSLEKPSESSSIKQLSQSFLLDFFSMSLDCSSCNVFLHSIAPISSKSTVIACDWWSLTVRVKFFLYCLTSLVSLTEELDSACILPVCLFVYLLWSTLIIFFLAPPSLILTIVSFCYCRVLLPSSFFFSLLFFASGLNKSRARSMHCAQ